MAEEVELSPKQKKEIAKWFLLNSPAGEIQYVAKGVQYSLLFFVFYLISVISIGIVLFRIRRYVKLIKKHIHFDLLQT